MKNRKRNIQSSGLNGFGRFGLHLIKYWLERAEGCNFKIDYINDDTISLEKAYKIINNDQYVKFNNYEIIKSKNSLIFLKQNGNKYNIEYTQNIKSKISWIGKPDIFLECSGKNPSKNDCLIYIKGNTKTVIISQTSWDADEILIYGYNHHIFNPEKHKVISYGSCTLNSYIPLANYINQKYKILNSDVNFIHNVPEYKLRKSFTLERRLCSLEKAGPLLLNFLNLDNFKINYTLVPYTGVSMFDFRFQVAKHIDKNKFINDLSKIFAKGDFKYLYKLDVIDKGPEVYKGTSYSAIFIKNNIQVLKNNIYLHGYFDNENSVNRYFDITNYLCRFH